MFALFLYSAPAAFGQCDANEVTLSLTFDNWPEEAGWSITDADGVEVAYAAAGDYATVPDGEVLMPLPVWLMVVTPLR